MSFVFQTAYGVVVLVDRAVWLWRNDYWAHLISDSSISELHEFAAKLGLYRISFQGDHYDVSSETRSRALQIGAEEVESRELVRRLRASGLRLSSHQRPKRWERVNTWFSEGALPDLSKSISGPLLEAFNGCVKADWSKATIIVYKRIGEVAIIVDDVKGPTVIGDLPEEVECHCTNRQVLELLGFGESLC
tara:strand:+ start:1374 stop:1946 length:573 start_codon:yes stop_codon:yes gene_type:complete